MGVAIKNGECTNKAILPICVKMSCIVDNLMLY